MTRARTGQVQDHHGVLVEFADAIAELLGSNQSRRRFQPCRTCTASRLTADALLSLSRSGSTVTTMCRAQWPTTPSLGPQSPEQPDSALRAVSTTPGEANVITASTTYFALLATCRSLSTLNTPGTPLARISAMARSVSESTTPVRVTLPFFTMMWMA